MQEPTVYIIDDDPSARSGLTRLVKAAGFNVLSFASAAEFLDSDDCERPGCIILDVQMPEMTGPELQDELRKVECTLPIIFISAFGDVPTTARTMKKGAVDFLTKPVDKNDLLKAIREALDKENSESNRSLKVAAIKESIKLLTAREYEVMTWVISGLLNKQIAGEMSISKETVKIHRGRVMKKLGIVSVAELVRMCELVGIAPAKQNST
jgi:FixJ family two-component response regulator